MADFTVKFFDRHLRPPKGGWHFTISGQLIEKFSESDILEVLRAWRTNNGTFDGEEALERELWEYYCGREPERCGGKAQPGGLRLPPGTKRELTPELVGPWIWQVLNLIGARWQLSHHGWFLSYCSMMSVLIDCPVCIVEWQSVTRSNPPDGLRSRAEVCQWINAVHNQVNARIGKAQYPYARMVIEYGAPEIAL